MLNGTSLWGSGEGSRGGDSIFGDTCQDSPPKKERKNLQRGGKGRAKNNDAAEFFFPQSVKCERGFSFCWMLLLYLVNNFSLPVYRWWGCQRKMGFPLPPPLRLSSSSEENHSPVLNYSQKEKRKVFFSVEETVVRIFFPKWILPTAKLFFPIPRPSPLPIPQAFSRKISFLVLPLKQLEHICGELAVVLYEFSKLQGRRPLPFPPNHDH